MMGSKWQIFLAFYQASFSSVLAAHSMGRRICASYALLHEPGMVNREMEPCMPKIRWTLGHSCKLMVVQKVHYDLKVVSEIRTLIVIEVAHYGHYASSDNTIETCRAAFEPSYSSLGS